MSDVSQLLDALADWFDKFYLVLPSAVRDGGINTTADLRRIANRIEALERQATQRNWAREFEASGTPVESNEAP